MLRIALQGLRGRRAPFAGAFVALAVAATVVMACGTLLLAGLRSQPPVQRYAAAPILVAGHQEMTVGAGTQNSDSAVLLERARIPAALAGPLAAVGGVRAAIADVAAPARVVGPDGPVAGPGGRGSAVHPWEASALAPYSLRTGSAPRGASDLVVDAGLARRGRLHVGEPVRLAAGGPARPMRVSGIVTGPADREGAMFVTRALADRLAPATGRADAIGILPAPRADIAALAARLRDVAGTQARVVTGARRGAVENVEAMEATVALLALCGTFGGLALLTAMFVVSGAIGLAVAQREREVALLRAVAATPRQVRRMVAWETLVVGLVASAMGVLPGLALAGALLQALAGRGVAPEDAQASLGLVPVICTVAGTAACALVAAIGAGRRAARVRPAQALADTATEPRGIGVVRCGAGAPRARRRARSGDYLGREQRRERRRRRRHRVRLRAHPGHGAARPAPRPRRGRARGAPAGATRARRCAPGGVEHPTSPRRFAAAMTPLVLSVALSSMLLLVAATKGDATARAGQPAHDRRPRRPVRRRGSRPPRSRRSARSPASARLRVSPRRRSDRWRQPPRRGPGRRRRSRGTRRRPRPRRAQRIDLGPARRHRGAQLVRGRGGRRRGRPGDHAHAGDGARRRARVVATYDRPLGLGESCSHRRPPPAIAPARDSTPCSSGSRRGVPADAVAARMRALAARYPGLSVGDRRDIAELAHAERETTAWLFGVVVAIVFVFTSIAVVNTLMMIGLHRGSRAGAAAAVRRHDAPGPRDGALGGRSDRRGGHRLGLGIALVALVPTSRALTGSPVPPVPTGLLALVLGAATRSPAWAARPRRAWPCVRAPSPWPACATDAPLASPGTRRFRGRPRGRPR